MSRRYHQSGNGRSWQFRPSDQAADASARYRKHGPIKPMEEPGFFARLFGAR